MPSHKLIVALAGALWAGSLGAQEQPPAIQPAGRLPAAEPELPVEPNKATTKAAAPATQPSAEELQAQLPRLFADLANADPAIRERARINLMGISRPDLAALEKLVRENLPLVPAQAAVLREIVTHVYLSGDGYPAVPQKGFLGVRLLEVSIVLRQDEHGANLPVEENPFDPRQPFAAGPPTTGVLIVERMPGFCGARSLLDGDVVLGVVERPGEPILNPSKMRDVVTSFVAGETIRFQLLRQGQVIEVPITLDPLPEAADPLIAGITAMQTLIDNRKLRSTDYWERTFAPMLKESAG